MKVKLTVYYVDGSSGIIEFEKPPGAHPDSIVTIAEGILVAEKEGKRVSKIGSSKINPLSRPPEKLVIDDKLISREEALKTLRIAAQPIPNKYASLYS